MNIIQKLVHSGIIHSIEGEGTNLFEYNTKLALHYFPCHLSSLLVKSLSIARRCAS